MVLYILGVKHQTTQIASPWQNGLKEFRFFYNHIRPHQHLNYRTPNEAWNNKPMANTKTHEAIYFSALCGNVAGFYFLE